MFHPSLWLPSQMLFYLQLQYGSQWITSYSNRTGISYSPAPLLLLLFQFRSLPRSQCVTLLGVSITTSVVTLTWLFMSGHFGIIHFVLGRKYVPSTGVRLSHRGCRKDSWCVREKRAKPSMKKAIQSFRSLAEEILSSLFGMTRPGVNRQMGMYPAVGKYREMLNITS